MKKILISLYCPAEGRSIIPEKIQSGSNGMENDTIQHINVPTALYHERMQKTNG